MNQYKITTPITVPGLANRKYESLSFTELKKRDHRTIGGDKGDVRFTGFTLDEENNQTILDNPVLVTTNDYNDEEAAEVAQEVVSFSFDSIGLETVEHN